MIDLRILALGAMALLMAVYGASTASGTGVKPRPAVASHGPVSIPDRGVHIDGFDLTH